MSFNRNKERDLYNVRNVLISLKRYFCYVEIVFYYLSMHRTMAVGGDIYRIARFLEIEPIQVKRAISILDEQDIIYLTEDNNIIMNPAFSFNGFDNKEREKMKALYQDFRKLKPYISLSALGYEDIDVNTGEVIKHLDTQ